MNRFIIVLGLTVATSFPTAADAGSNCVHVLVATTSTEVQVGHCVTTTPGGSICHSRDVSRPPTYVAVTICVPDLPAPPPA